jgi:hypothetical protein
MTLNYYKNPNNANNTNNPNNDNNTNNPNNPKNRNNPHNSNNARNCCALTKNSSSSIWQPRCTNPYDPNNTSTLITLGP